MCGFCEANTRGSPRGRNDTPTFPLYCTDSGSGTCDLHSVLARNLDFKLYRHSSLSRILSGNYNVAPAPSVGPLPLFNGLTCPICITWLIIVPSGVANKVLGTSSGTLESAAPSQRYGLASLSTSSGLEQCHCFDFRWWWWNNLRRRKRTFGGKSFGWPLSVVWHIHIHQSISTDFSPSQHSIAFYCHVPPIPLLCTQSWNSQFS